MGIWILKQDGKGIVYPTEINIFRNSKGYSIRTERGTDIGFYSTEEKAKLVIIMILDAIESYKYKLDAEIHYCNPTINFEFNSYFKMPKDNEVNTEE